MYLATPTVSVHDRLVRILEPCIVNITQAI